MGALLDTDTISGTAVQQLRAGYFFLNAALYAGFALACTLAPEQMAQALGYAALAPGGRSEFLVVYGGLQLGLALVFYCFARQTGLHRVGLQFALTLYSPIVCFRAATLLMHWPVTLLTLITTCLENMLLIVAMALNWIRR